MIRKIAKEEDTITSIVSCSERVYYSVKDKIKGVFLKDLSGCCELRGHKSTIHTLELSELDGESILISGSKDKTVKFWSLESYKCIRTFYGHKDSVICIYKHKDTLFSASKDGVVRSWDLKSGKCLYQMKLESPSDSMIYHELTNSLFVNSCNGSVYSIHIDGLDASKEELFSSSISGMTIGAAILFTGWEDNTIRLFDIKTSNTEKMLFGHSKPPSKMQYLKGMLFSASSQEFLLWNIHRGEYRQINLSSQEFYKFHAQNSPNGVTIITLSIDQLTIYEENIKDLVQESLKQEQIDRINDNSTAEFILEDCALTSFPDISIKSPQHLERISVRNNTLRRFFYDIGVFSNLVYLNCSNNEIESVPETIKDLKNLSYLSLEKNKLTTIPSCFGDLNSLVELRLGYNGLSRIPKELSNLSKLKILDLSHNSIKYLSPSLAKLDALNEFLLGNNKLHSDSRKVVKKVEKKNSSRSRRDSSLTISERKSTKKLDNKRSKKVFTITKSSKKDDKSISKAYDDQSSDKTRNRTKRSQSCKSPKSHIINDDKEDSITVYEFPFSELKTLEILDLSNNNLTSIPEYLSKTKGLTYLNLSNNCLKEIDEGMFDLLTLHTLDISSNQIILLPDNISNLRRLREFYANDNCITEIPINLRLLSHLEKFVISNNQLRVLPYEVLGRLMNLHELNLSSNHFNEFPPDITSLADLKLLNLSNNNLKTVPFEMAYMVKLNSLDLSLNRLVSIPFKCLESLSYLNVSGNEMKEVHDDISRLRALKSLDISDNKIESISPQIGSLYSLESLDLQNNKLKLLPSTVSLLPNLKCLQLKGNHNIANVSPFDIEVNSTEYLMQHIFDSAYGGFKEPNRIQICFCGLEGSGKTSLYKRLKSGKLKKKPKPTRGIDFDEWTTRIACPVDGRIKQKKVNLFVKDFSGNSALKIMHQLFMTDHSIYVIVWNLVLDENRSDIDYWLNCIRSCAPNASIIIVGTHLDNIQNDDMIKELKRKYSKENNVTKIIPVSSFTGTNLDDLRSHIFSLVTKSVLFDLKVPLSVNKLASNIIKEKAQYPTPLVEISDFQKLCSRYNIDQQNISSTIKHLIYSGLIIELNGAPKEKPIIVLDPKWLCDILYSLISFKSLENGYLKHENLENVWKNSPTPFHYSFISMIHRMEIVVDNGGDHKASRNFYANISILPSLLPERDQNLKKYKVSELVKIYRLGFVPPDFVSKMISRISKKMKVIEMWRSGAQFESINQSEEIEEEGQKSNVLVEVEGPNIRLSIQGHNVFTFLQFIANTIENIVIRYHTKELRASAYYICYENNEPRIFPLQKIENELKNGRDKVYYNDSFYIDLKDLGMICKV